MARDGAESELLRKAGGELFRVDLAKLPLSWSAGGALRQQPREPGPVVLDDGPDSDQLRRVL
jgi:hypothetical protein